MQVDKLSSGIYTKYISAGWSSLEARRAHNPKVVGSNPAPQFFAKLKPYGRVAQSVEHLTFNQVVPGSNPHAHNFEIAEILMQRFPLFWYI